MARVAAARVTADTATVGRVAEARAPVVTVVMAMERMGGMAAATVEMVRTRHHCSNPASHRRPKGN
ncbi:hypothetical protein BN2476_300070 [Paraburkholderia piptadeniae]|uniref:Uncharacterized protein n=1 Tax=Paraburkholderia piptadeniae TaxID=1701573 RepID=A0A1N7S2H6_9BURK|nr:hypothetical protein BN2476_300070 [Paraburkholderia piptadeniae]